MIPIPPRLSRLILAGFAAVILVGGNAAVASPPQSLTMTVPVGTVTNLGTQYYLVSGGSSFGGLVEGQQVNGGGSIDYTLAASQSGMTTHGYGSIRMSGTTVDGVRFSISGAFVVDSAVAAGSVGSSELPLYFVASSPAVRMTLGGTTEMLNQPLLIESPYWNPFGGPITITTQDGSTLSIAASYRVGLVFWQGSQVAGSVEGTLGGSTPVSGMLSLTTNEIENLVTGTAADSGTITFASMTPSSLDSQGAYHGTSTIPLTGTSDCSSYFPVLPGTCTYTGFTSQGSFHSGDITGTYTTQWTSPALAFTTSITAFVSQGQQGSDHGSGFLWDW